MTTHPATRVMVDYYAGWYDRHFDLEWQDLLLAQSNANGERIPVAFLVPQSADDLRRMRRSFGTTIFPTAGNVTHTPAYGNLIALGISTPYSGDTRHRIIWQRRRNTGTGWPTAGVSSPFPPAA
jgi:aromatic ring hydroxylase